MFRQYFWGLLLIVLGILFLLDNANILDFGTIVSRYWPVLLILWGLQLLWKKKNSSENPEPVASEPGDTKGSYQGGEDIQTSTLPARGQTYNNVFGDVRLSFDNQTVTTFTVSNVFGDIELDFRNADFTDQSHVKINGVFGDVLIRVPSKVAVSGKANFLAGSARVFNDKHDGLFRNITFQNPSATKTKKSVGIDISILFGDVQISG